MCIPEQKVVSDDIYSAATIILEVYTTLEELWVFTEGYHRGMCTKVEIQTVRECEDTVPCKTQKIPLSPTLGPIRGYQDLAENGKRWDDPTHHLQNFPRLIHVLM